MYTFFSHPSEISYKASFCSKIGVFYWVTTILTFIPPLLIAYRSQGFWQKIDSYEEQPDIHFEHDLIVLLETSDPDETIGWSTMSNFNSFLGGNRVRTPMIKSTETDWNRDGVLDYIDFDIEMPLQDHEIIYGVQLHMLFDFKLYKFSHFHMQGLVVVATSTGLPTSGMDINGDLSLVQKQPLAHKGLDERYAGSLFNKSSIFAETFDMRKILAEYSGRNVSLRLNNEYIMWERGATSLGNPFKIQVHFNYPVQRITYYTGFWQMMKWAWVQYVSTLIVFIFFFRHVKTFVFSKQVLPSIVSVKASKDRH
eukprot:04002.XXX_92781_91733_1 [CDS] Oithona nana genome sequencing.